MSRYPPRRISLLVRNLPLDGRPDELRDMFSRYGEVRDVYLPRDYYTDRPRGFGFVEFLNRRDAEDAMYHLDGSNYAGRQLSVVMSKESRKTPGEMYNKERYRSGGRRHHYSSDRRRSYSRSQSPRHRRRSYSRSPHSRRPERRSRSPVRDSRRYSRRSVSPTRRGRREESPYSEERRNRNMRESPRDDDRRRRRGIDSRSPTEHKRRHERTTHSHSSRSEKRDHSQSHEHRDLSKSRSRSEDEEDRRVKKRQEPEGDNIGVVDNGEDRKEGKAGSLSPATGRHDVDVHDDDDDAQMSDY